jgi:hypothetical protein
VGSVPEQITAPYVYLQRARAAHERTLDQQQGEIPFEEVWDLELIVDDPEDLATIAELIRGLDCACGAFGAGTMQVLYLEDQADDYVPKGTFADQGLDVAAWSVTVLGYAPGA